MHCQTIPTYTPIYYEIKKKNILAQACSTCKSHGNMLPAETFETGIGLLTISLTKQGYSADVILKAYYEHIK